MKYTGNDGWYDFDKLGYPAELVIENDIMLAETADEVVNKLAYLKDEVGSDDFCVAIKFGDRGLDHEADINQMEAFAENVLPHI